jgi:hypothetical protein
MIRLLFMALGLCLGIGQICDAMELPYEEPDQDCLNLPNMTDLLDLPEIVVNGEDLSMEKLDLELEVDKLLDLPNTPAFFTALTPNIIPTAVDRETFECIFCKSVFDSAKLRNRHIQQHRNEDDDLYHCPYPGCQIKVKNGPKGLMIHYDSVHVKKRPFSCNLCLQTFTTERFLKRHLKRGCSETSKKFRCECCKKSYINGASYENHIKKCAQFFKQSSISTVDDGNNQPENLQG